MFFKKISRATALAPHAADVRPLLRGAAPPPTIPTSATASSDGFTQLRSDGRLHPLLESST